VADLKRREFIRRSATVGTIRRRAKEEVSMNLTQEDWSEIYNALASKHAALQAGEYGESDGDLNVEAWAAHLQQIMTKIGPDGEDAFREVASG
jgi:hypothetical protein